MIEAQKQGAKAFGFEPYQASSDEEYMSPGQEEHFREPANHGYQAIADLRLGLHMVPSFHRDLVRGVASYWMEFFEAVAGDPPAVVFVPVGLGSGISACASARAATNARAKIVGVVSAHAPAYLDSVRAGRVVESPVTTRLADGMACRVPDEGALALIRREVDDVIAVSDEEVAAAMRALFADTHNVAEGAGAAALAGALQQRARCSGHSIGVALSGGNVDSDVFARVLAGGCA